MQIKLDRTKCGEIKICRVTMILVQDFDLGVEFWIFGDDRLYVKYEIQLLVLTNKMFEKVGFEADNY